MHEATGDGYGLWWLTAIMVVIASWLAYRYLAPKGWREWSRAGLVQAFIIALYAERYGFPLPIYLLTGAARAGLPQEARTASFAKVPRHLSRPLRAAHPLAYPPDARALPPHRLGLRSACAKGGGKDEGAIRGRLRRLPKSRAHVHPASPRRAPPAPIAILVARTARMTPCA